MYVLKINNKIVLRTPVHDSDESFDLDCLDTLYLTNESSESFKNDDWAQTIDKLTNQSVYVDVVGKLLSVHEDGKQYLGYQLKKHKIEFNFYVKKFNPKNLTISFGDESIVNINANQSLIEEKLKKISNIINVDYKRVSTKYISSTKNLYLYPILHGTYLFYPYCENDGYYISKNENDILNFIWVSEKKIKEIGPCISESGDLFSFRKLSPNDDLLKLKLKYGNIFVI